MDSEAKSRRAKQSRRVLKGGSMGFLHGLFDVTDNLVLVGELATMRTGNMI